MNNSGVLGMDICNKQTHRVLTECTLTTVSKFVVHVLNLRGYKANLYTGILPCKILADIDYIVGRVAPVMCCVLLLDPCQMQAWCMVYLLMESREVL